MSQEPTKASLTLWQKIAAISKEVGFIEKTGKNEHFKYKFIEHSNVVGTIRPILDEYGVTIDLEAMDATFSDGKRVLLHMRYTVTNADKPEENFSRLWVSEAMDQQDKGINKALTAAEKNVFMKLFHISDVDPDGDDEPQPAKRNQGQQKPSQPTQAAPQAPRTVTPATPSAPKPATTPATQPEMISQNEIDMIMTLAGSKGLDEIDIGARVIKQFGKELKALDLSEARNFYGGLLKAK